jgi:hypothetical protein
MENKEYILDVVNDEIVITEPKAKKTRKKKD